MSKHLIVISLSDEEPRGQRSFPAAGSSYPQNRTSSSVEFYGIPNVWLLADD